MLPIEIILCRYAYPASRAFNAIGFGGQMLFQLKEDMCYFRRTTTEAPKDTINMVIMGYNTAISLGTNFPLKGRMNVVITSSHYTDMTNLYPDILVARSMEDALHIISNPPAICRHGRAFIIGGVALYNFFHHYASTFHITSITDRVEYIEDAVAEHGLKDFSTISSALYPATMDYEMNMRINETEYNVPTLIRNWLLRGTMNDDKSYETPVIHYVIERFHKHRHPEYQYLDLCERILHTGTVRDTRNGRVRSLFGAHLEFNIARDGFPLLTTKRVYWRGVLRELLWFLRADTDATRLQKDGVHIWDGNSSRKALDHLGLQHYREGDCGPIYGYQWRHFGAPYSGCDNEPIGGVDQLAIIINELRTNPHSRRLFMSAWNPVQLPEMCLPPCHISYQFYVESNGSLSVQLYQRSADVFLGLPFNIASTATLLTMVASITNYKVGRVLISIGDAHIYEEHIEAVREQLSRKPLPLPKLRVLSRKNINDFREDDVELLDYHSHEPIKAKMMV